MKYVHKKMVVTQRRTRCATLHKENDTLVYILLSTIPQPKQGEETTRHAVLEHFRKLNSLDRDTINTVPYAAADGRPCLPLDHRSTVVPPEGAPRQADSLASQTSRSASTLGASGLEEIYVGRD